MTTDHEWLSDLRRYWPVIVGFVAVIALVVRVIDGQSAGIDRYHILKASGDSTRAIVDTLKDNQQFMAYMFCDFYRTLHPDKKLPRKCEDVFHGWGYP